MRKAEADYIIGTMLDSFDNVSDLNITVGKMLQVESSGQLTGIDVSPAMNQLTPFQTEIIALNLISSDKRLTESLVDSGSCDFSYFIQGKARFRGNIFSQRNNYTIILRKLETKIPSLKDLSLPDVFLEVAKEKNGMILVTGATGSGKSTTLAALLNEMNESKSIHIVTLEDPIEFVHPHKQATFNQRELGSDYDSFASGLRAALRQAPKIILVGEMRDRETVEIGLSASETGHLLLSTLHTVDAGQTINRIVGMFSKEEEQQIRIRLAETIRYIICQRLVPKVGGGRVAILEIMGTNLRVKDSIVNGESEGKTFYEIIEAAASYGWMTFDMALSNAYKAGHITEENAMAYASRKAVVGRNLDRMKAERGEKTTDIENLSMDMK